MTNNRKYQDPFRGYRRSQSNAAVMEPQLDDSMQVQEGMGSLMNSDSSLVADVLPPTGVPSLMGAALQGLMGSGPMPTAEAMPAPAVQEVAMAPPPEPPPMPEPTPAPAPKMEEAPEAAPQAAAAPAKGKGKAGLVGVLAWLRTPE